MLEIKQVVNETMASECDKLLTKLIQSERRFDSNTKEDYIVKDLHKEKYDKDYNALFLAYINSQAVGFISGFWKKEAGEMVEKSTGCIDSLYVKEDYRHLGVATALMNAFYDWCHTKEIKIVNICVFIENEEAFKLYQNQGFEAICYYMQKEIK